VQAPPPWRSLLSAGVAAAQITWLDDDAIDDSGLFPGERAAVQRAVLRRRAQFAAGRLCARRAMALLGRAAEEILMGAQRQPLWPAGLVGSLSHINGYCVAAVAPAASSRALGIDVELAIGLDQGLWSTVLSDAEARWTVAAETTGSSAALWAKLIFSAKEALFKCQFPLTQDWLGFLDAEIRPDPAAGTFLATFGKSAGQVPRGTTWLGRYAIDGARVHTAVELPA
jgi:4'-phosphopantetheinyl transferase EntD